MKVYLEKKHNGEVFLLEKIFVEIIVTKFCGNQSGYNAHSLSKLFFLIKNFLGSSVPTEHSEPKL